MIFSFTLRIVLLTLSYTILVFAVALPSNTSCHYTVPGVGQFNTHVSANFTNMSVLPAWLRKSTDLINADPTNTRAIARLGMAENVRFDGDGTLSLVVNGCAADARPAIVPVAEIDTTYSDILYGSVRTVAQVSSPAGTTNGFFFYASDTQETDIEICTDNTRAIHYTNQRTNPQIDPSPSTVNQTYEIDLAADYHEYRIDWLPGVTRFYLDGELQATLERNIATTPSTFIWNNWSNGDPGWSAGPPTTDSVMKIRSIDAYFNRTSVVGICY